MTEVISVKDLVMIYPDGTKAVDGVSFHVEDGEFFGFLGPNGAGKSTTIKILTTLLHKTSGEAKISGYDVEKDAGQIRKIVGLQAQETVIDWDLTGRENLVLEGNLHQMRGKQLQERVTELLKIVGLDEVADKRAAFYSGGMKKRLDLASVLVHRPKILFLDEPTTGLDPQSRAGIWDYLRQLNRDEKITIFLTTQYMEEADRLCSRLSIVDLGKIVAQGTPSELKGEIGADAINLTFENNNGKDLTGLKEEGKKIVGGLNGVTEVVNTDMGLTVYAKNGAYLIPDIVRSFDEAQIRVASLNLSTPTLDDVFLKHTGKRIRVEELSKQYGGMFGRRRR
jgi:ABC-2 type transport system ATP-binding protein